jgi:hypothetical protein
MIMNRFAISPQRSRDRERAPLAPPVQRVASMPRKLQVDVFLLTGAVAECVIWVNNNLVLDQAPDGDPATASWKGKIPIAKTPVTIEASGIGTSRYRVKITVDDQVVTDVDRQLQGGVDAFERSI